MCVCVSADKAQADDPTMANSEVNKDEQRRVTFNYRSTNMPEEMKDILSFYDLTKSGNVSGGDLVAGAMAMRQMCVW